VSSQPVVVITGASQGIGAGLVVGYRRLGYAVVANSRKVTPSHDPMVLAVARDIAQHGIRCNAVALGDIRPPTHDPATYAALTKRHPLRRVGAIDDVVKAVLYLENSPFVTGEILHVDGGQSAGH
jgi:NAD(P)-dependent dehydrogenase (short-subunit alcohol dehydrogenase family)